MKNKFLITIFIALIFGVIFAPLYLFLRGSKVSPTESKPKIATTIFPIYDIAKNIAGDKTDVVLILPAGASAHTFDPNPLDIAKLEGVNTLFKVGVGLDDWIEKMADPSIVRVDLSTFVNLLKSTDPHENNTEFDPHYWLSVDNATLIANKVKNELVKIDLANEDYYQGNLDIYLTQLEKLKIETEAELKNYKGRGIITFHSAFNYFVGDYGLKVIATIEPFAGKEPTPLYLKNVLEVIKINHVKVVFKEPQLSSDLLSSYINDFGVKILTLDPLGGVDNTNSYSKLMRFNANAIKEGLSL